MPRRRCWSCPGPPPPACSSTLATRRATAAAASACRLQLCCCRQASSAVLKHAATLQTRGQCIPSHTLADHAVVLIPTGCRLTDRYPAGNPDGELPASQRPSGMLAGAGPGPGKCSSAVLPDAPLPSASWPANPSSHFHSAHKHTHPCCCCLRCRAGSRGAAEAAGDQPSGLPLCSRRPHLRRPHRPDGAHLQAGAAAGRAHGRAHGRMWLPVREQRACQLWRSSAGSAQAELPACLPLARCTTSRRAPPCLRST